MLMKKRVDLDCMMSAPRIHRVVGTNVYRRLLAGR
jgi:hypothetical protein